MTLDPAGRWSVERVVGSSAVIHALEIPADPGPTVWLVEATDRAVVLGSTQPETDIDVPAAAAAGIDVVRRRSGGGAVLVDPGSIVWIDVILPAGDDLWDPDVGRSGLWLGDVWRGTFARLGIDTAVQRGPMVPDPLARTVCFVGRAPAEVMVGAEKVVGIAERRTRAAARFQCAALLQWHGDELLRVLRPLGAADADRVRSTGHGVALPAAVVIDAFLAELAAR